jgi:hypothetical protein
MAAATIANVPEILKNIWKDEIHDFLYEDCPGFGMVPKDTSWVGLQNIITVQYGGMAGVSADFAVAQAHKSPPKYKRMNVETSDLFGLWSVDHKLITLSRNDRGALVRALNENTEKALTKIKRRTSQMFWRNGGGSLGAGTFSTVTWTFADKNDVRNVDLDDVVEFSTDNGTGGAGVLGGGSSTRTVVAIDEDLGTVTLSSAPPASSAFIFHAGTYGKAFYGVASYVPPATPGTGGVPASIWGMNRTDFPTRLAGHRFASTSANVVEDIKAALTKAFRRNARVTHLFCAPEVFEEVEMELQGQRRYIEQKVGKVGFSGLEFSSQSGRVVGLYSDSDIPKNTAGKRLVYGLNLPKWKFHSAEAFPQWLNIKGDKSFMLEENANASEGRVGGYAQTYTIAPGENFVLTLAA